MNYWLVKSEPDVYSFDQLMKDKKTSWDGVRNYEARNNLRTMKKGDQVFFYHSNTGKEIVGLAKVVKEHYQDPTTDDANWVTVELAPVKKFKNPVTLEFLKKHKTLSTMALVKKSRISVTIVTPEEFDKIMELSGVE
ncbi:MAG TPA: EVE domain-containing protein [Cytophagaceae bacterium]|jgi:predicted RNA-binding protein with PUA-like domain|nr:EVE domain-containing protein [Cytophagaceae bacterium]